MPLIYLKIFTYYLFLFLCAFFIYKKFIPIFKKRLVDLPNKRSSHVNPTPTSGGMIFTSLTTLISLINGNLINLISFPISIIGFIDDIKNIKPIYRYFSQLITIILIMAINSFSNNYLSLLINRYLILIPIIIFLLSGLINFINFMDGIDGLVGGCMLVIFIFISININNSFWPLIPTLFAFLIFNWSPSKIFMGDSGSLFLGSIYATALIQSPTSTALIKLIFVGAPLFLDSIICIIKRATVKQNIFSPHKSHLYQRLVSAGYSHSKVSSLYILSTILLSLIASYFGYKLLILSTLFILFIGIILDKYFAIAFHESIVKKYN